MPIKSPFLQRKPTLLERLARRRIKRRGLIARAPKHPARIEARLQLIMLRIAIAISARIREGVEHRRTHRHDAPKPRTLARKELRKTLQPIANDMAKDVHQQVAASLGVKPADLDIDLGEQAYGMVDSLVSMLEEYPIEATHRVNQAFAEWESAAEEDRTTEALSALLDDAFAGAEGKLRNSVRLLFGDTFGTMNQAAQVQAGVKGYHWLSMRDDAVRPAHAALDDPDEVYSWDDPPLSAAKSSNGEDCHPGDDYSCRCIAVPVMEDEASGAEEGDSEA